MSGRSKKSGSVAPRSGRESTTPMANASQAAPAAQQQVPPSTAAPAPVASTPVNSNQQPPAPSSTAQQQQQQQQLPRPASPLSPTRHSRIVEKVELQNLNDRLAAYIDRVRYLETENARLTVEVQSTHETVHRETSNIKQMYEHELGDARKLLDETAREKAKLEIDTKRLWEENDELRQRTDRLAKELATAEQSARVHESRSSELSGKLSSSLSAGKKAAEEARQAKEELDRIRKQLDELRKNLEEETLGRVDLENIVQSLREELTFKDQVHGQELSETRSRRQLDISEIDGRLAEQYEAKLALSLQELREQYEGQMRINRDEIESLFENKMRTVQSSAQRQSQVAGSALEELRVSRSRVDGLNGRIADLEGQANGLNARIRELERLLDGERQRHLDDEAEMGRMRDEMAQQLQEYQDLMDIKVSLDLEIAAYDKLLCGEELRLNIQPSTTAATASQMSASFNRSSGRTTPGFGGGIKRKRTTLLDSTAVDSEEHHLSDYAVNASAKGDLEVAEVDPEGRFVRVSNRGATELAIGGWRLVATALPSGAETLFKFHRSVKAEANGGTVTVWSMDAGTAHEPPANIVMKQQRWQQGDEVAVRVLNDAGDEVASLERTRHRLTTRASRVRDQSSTVGDAEDLYHQQGDPKTQEKCSIM